jgi:uncharacterized protein YciI
VGGCNWQPLQITKRHHSSIVSPDTRVGYSRSWINLKAKGEMHVIFAAVIEYVKDEDKLKSFFPAHRKYLQSVIAAGQLISAGPLIDDGGAIWVVQAETREKADELVRNDPYNKEGAFVKWEILSFLYYSARANKAAPPAGHRGGMPS